MRGVVGTMSTIFGWTFDQWANATAIFKVQPKTIYEAGKLKAEWPKRYRYPPSSEVVIVIPGETQDQRAMDYEAATHIFTLVPHYQL